MRVYQPGKYECALEALIASAMPRGLDPDGFRARWAAFDRLDVKIARQFEPLPTTITAPMARVLFTAGLASAPGTLVTAGVYGGFATAWMMRDRGDIGPHWNRCIGFDVDQTACDVAHRNLTTLGHRSCDVRCEDAVAGLSRLAEPIRMLFIDIDEGLARKDRYADVFEAALPWLAAGSVVAAHDACHPLFEGAFRRFARAVEASGRAKARITLPIDDCGLDLVVMQ